MKAIPKNLLNICFVIAFWCVCLLLLPLGVNWERQGDEGRSVPQVRRSSKSPLFVNRALNREWEQSRLVQVKIARFKERAPRQDLVARLLPTGGRRPGELSIFLGDEWGKESEQTQKELMKTWGQLWKQLARTTSHDEANSRLRVLFLNREVR